MTLYIKIINTKIFCVKYFSWNNMAILCVLNTNFVVINIIYIL